MFYLLTIQLAYYAEFARLRVCGIRSVTCMRIRSVVCMRNSLGYVYAEFAKLRMQNLLGYLYTQLRVCGSYRRLGNFHCYFISDLTD